MGTFFTNIQIFTGNDAGELVRNKLTASIKGILAEKNYTYVNKPTEGNVRRIYISRVPDDSWISVVDSELEFQNTLLLHEMALMFSSALKTIVLSILVHDGDLLEMGVYQNGNKIDEFNNWPGYFSGHKQNNRNIALVIQAKINSWIALLSKYDAKQSFQPYPSESYFSSEIFNDAVVLLKKIAKLLKLNEKFCTIDANSIINSQIIQYDELYFLANEDENNISKSYLPELHYESVIEDVISLIQGDSKVFNLIAHNTGKSSIGLEVVVWGASIEARLVEVKKINVQAGKNEEKNILVNTDSLARNADDIVQVSLHELEYFGGFQSPAEAINRKAKNFADGLNDWLETRILTTIEVSAIKTGEGELHFGLVPIENADEGQITWSTLVRIKD